MTAEQRQELQAITDAVMVQQARLEAFTVDCPEALEAFEALDLCTDELYELAEDPDKCTVCGEDSTGGDGWNGMCGSCADKAERRRSA